MGKEIGITLIIISFILWIFIFMISWFPISTTLKATIVTIFIILGEVFFWGGSALVGKDIVKKYIKDINPITWIRKK